MRNTFLLSTFALSAGFTLDGKEDIGEETEHT